MAKIVIHCSDSPQGRGDNAETIHKWHKQRGWAGIGYHYVILEDGTVERGRPEYWKGAHTRGHNKAIGICLIGIDEFTTAQFDSVIKLINDSGVESNQVIGHRDVSDKTCPNFDIQKIIKMYKAKE